MGRTLRKLIFLSTAGLLALIPSVCAEDSNEMLISRMDRHFSAGSNYTDLHIENIPPGIYYLQSSSDLSAGIWQNRIRISNNSTTNISYNTSLVQSEGVSNQFYRVNGTRNELGKENNFISFTRTLSRNIFKLR